MRERTKWRMYYGSKTETILLMFHWGELVVKEGWLSSAVRHRVRARPRHVHDQVSVRPTRHPTKEELQRHPHCRLREEELELFGQLDLEVWLRKLRVVRG